MPANLTFAQAAAIPLTALTSWQALFEAGQLKAGHSVLIHAGAGGTGGMAIQLAKHAGATVFTTASAANYGYVRSLEGLTM
jgi:NADPH2:quinone reductase